MRDSFRPLTQPAQRIYDAIQDEATKRRDQDDWEYQERLRVFKEAKDYAQQHGLSCPTMDQVLQCELSAACHTDYAAQWAHCVARLIGRESSVRDELTSADDVGTSASRCSSVSFVGVVSGDEACFCWDEVPRQEHDAITGCQQQAGESAVEGNLCGRLYPSDVCHFLVCDDGRRYRFTITVEFVDCVEEFDGCE